MTWLDLFYDIVTFWNKPALLTSALFVSRLHAFRFACYHWSIVICIWHKIFPR